MDYYDLDDLRSDLGNPSTDFNDQLERVITSASGAIDELLDTTFGKASEESSRVYTPAGPLVVVTDDFADISEVAVDRSRTGTFTEVWADTDWVSYPENAEAKGKPIQWLKARAWPRTFCLAPQSVRVTGHVGWPRVPAQVIEACGLLATQVWKRRREVQFGVLGLDQQTASRVLRSDPHLCLLLDPFQRNEMVA